MGIKTGIQAVSRLAVSVSHTRAVHLYLVRSSAAGGQRTSALPAGAYWSLESSPCEVMGDGFQQDSFPGAPALGCSQLTRDQVSK